MRITNSLRLEEVPMIIASYEKLSMIKYTTFSSAARLKKGDEKITV